MSTPNKGPAPASGDLNGKKVDEKIIEEKPITDDTTKVKETNIYNPRLF